MFVLLFASLVLNVILYFITQISHTSDHFAKCEELARKMILDGKAYMDDTDQERMQKERLSFINSYRRGTLPEENLKLFEAMLAGKKDTSKGEVDATKFCLRAKIDMQSPNGTLRDPVLYRFNDTPHHRTGKLFRDTCITTSFTELSNPQGRSTRDILLMTLPVPSSILSKV